MHDPLPLPLAMLIIFGSAKLLAELFGRLGQPGIVGEILAGALVGPSVLGWIHPNDMLKALSDLGVMFLLFGVGLEVKASESPLRFFPPEDCFMKLLARSSSLRR